jgi:hypothetical protein
MLKLYRCLKFLRKYLRKINLRLASERNYWANDFSVKQNLSFDNLDCTLDKFHTIQCKNTFSIVNFLTILQTSGWPFLLWNLRVIPDSGSICLNENKKSNTFPEAKYSNIFYIFDQDIFLFLQTKIILSLYFYKYNLFSFSNPNYDPNKVLLISEYLHFGYLNYIAKVNLPVVSE